MNLTAHDDNLTTAQQEKITSFQEQLAGEEMGRFHRKEAFLCHVFSKARKFLELKQTNSVNVILRLDLEQPLSRRSLCAQAIVRMHFSGVTQPAGTPRFDWQLASAAREDIRTRLLAECIDNPFVPEGDEPTAIGFLGREFGQGMTGWRWHFPQVAKIDAVLSMADPRGLFLILRGSSDQVTWSKGGVVDPHQSLNRFHDDIILMRPTGLPSGDF